MKPTRVSLMLLAALYMQPAAAYLDPATGSILLQGLMALFAGIAVTVRLYWNKLKRWFGAAVPDDADGSGGADDQGQG